MQFRFYPTRCMHAMNPIRRSIAVFVIAVLFAVPAEVVAQDYDSPSIAEIAANDDNFSTLAAALEAADLVEVLDGEGPFTVFAPTNEAFDALPEEELEALLAEENRELLINILTFHVVEGAVTSSEVVELDEATTLQGATVPIEVDGDVVRVGTTQVIQADIEASNGVIHVIDGILYPPADQGGGY